MQGRGSRLAAGAVVADFCTFLLNGDATSGTFVGADSMLLNMCETRWKQRL